MTADDDLTPPPHLDRRGRQHARDFVEHVARLGGGSIECGDVKVVIPASDRAVTPEHNEAGAELPLQAPDGPTRNRPGGMNVGRLPSFINRIEKLEEERAEIGSDIRDVYSEAKGAGYDIKTIRALVRLRRMDAADRAEQETLLDTYKHALGMV